MKWSRRPTRPSTNPSSAPRPEPSGGRVGSEAMPLPDTAPEPFRLEDGDRVICFGRGAIADVPAEIGEGYALLTTPRGRERADPLAAAAAAVHDVPPGRVDEIAAGLRGAVRADTLVALGGGRVIDVAKALAAADP